MKTTEAQLADFSAQLERYLTAWQACGDTSEHWYVLFMPEGCRCRLIKGSEPITKGWCLLSPQHLSPESTVEKLLTHFMQIARTQPILMP